MLKTIIRACVYTRDYRDIDDLHRILAALRGIGVSGWNDYKRDFEAGEMRAALRRSPAWR